MIDIKNKVDCCGCNACGDVCAHEAITFVTDNEGFWYPKVDMEKCVDCHLCEKVCPIINVKELKKNDLPESICYAAEHKNLEVVFDSTSGGLFSALADVMYRSEGYVGGAVFGDDFKSVHQFISNEKKDLPRLRSSKYLQSSLIGFYKQVRDLCREGKNVLVCGSPCQMAAMRAFLRKDYPNLIIADYICRGINSPKVWGKYIDSFEERYGHKVVYAKAKSKEYGWRNLTQKVILDNGEEHFETRNQSDFTKGYLHTGVYCRPACYECKFKGYPRIADITLADFWGIENVDQSMEKNLGTSLVMVNSKKGEAFFERVKSRINYKHVPFNSIEKGNPALNKPLDPPLVDRDEFFDDLNKMNFMQIADKYIHPKKPQTAAPAKSNHIRNAINVLRNIHHLVGNDLSAWRRVFKYNSLEDIKLGNILLTTPYCTLHIDKTAKIIKHGVIHLGASSRFEKSKLETRLYVGRNATLDFGQGTTIGYGADIEVFDNATLRFGGSGGSNIGLTIICGQLIEIGKDTMMGRNVTIRDNNGAHYLNRPGYKDCRPVRIAEKVWICEQATIMPGVKIGFSGIVGARAFVTGHVPAHALVSGNPAQIVDEDVLWKY